MFVAVELGVVTCAAWLRCIVPCRVFGGYLEEHIFDTRKARKLF